MYTSSHDLGFIFREPSLCSPGNIYFLLNFFRDAGPKCPVDNERLTESQVSKCFLAQSLKLNQMKNQLN